MSLLGPLAEDPWVSDPSSSTARPTSSSSAQSSSTPRSRPLLASDTTRPSFRSIASTEGSASVWNLDDPLSSDDAISEFYRGRERAEALEADKQWPESEGMGTQTIDMTQPANGIPLRQAESGREASVPHRLSTTESPKATRDSRSTPPSPSPSTSTSPHIDYHHLHTLCAAGDVKGLEVLFVHTQETQGIPLSILANTPNPTSGLAPVHYAAKEGKVDALKWLIRVAGASAHTRDREGETALHKAALAGKLPALTYLLSISSIEADIADADGWTPLHNACSKGYLDIVKSLISSGNASLELRGGCGGWTPLMNAASNGHLPVVRFLTARCQVDPFVRNSSGETAYDVAAAKFEIYICEILEAYELRRWTFRWDTASARPRYNPLQLHVTVPVVIHQNERLDARLSTLAVYGGKPRWSGTSAGRPGEADRRAPATMPPGPLSTSKQRPVPMRREDVQVPTRSEPYKLRLPARRIVSGPSASAEASLQDGEDLASTPTRQSVLQESRRSSEEPSHFWLSEWQIDRTHPQVDPREGWQYAQSFDAPEEVWCAQVPAPLERLLEGKGLSASLGRALASPASRNATGPEDDAVSRCWVRRRRWVRVLRRRLDIQFGDELEAAGDVSALKEESVAESAVADKARSEAAKLSPSASYLDRAQALADGDGVGSTDNGEETDHDRIIRLELALAEIRMHAFEDDDRVRQAQAEMLLQKYSARVGGMLRAVYGNEGLLDSDDDDPNDEIMHQNSFKDTQLTPSRVTPTNSSSASLAAARQTRPPVNHTLGIGPAALEVGADVPTPASSPTPSQLPNHSTASRAEGQATDAGASAQQRAADLARASEFRVPTNEAPQSQAQFSSRSRTVLQPTSLAPTWEPDESAQSCRGCSRRFTFFTRKHHCRRCGRIFCGDCSSHRAQLSAEELVIDPAQPEMFLSERMGGLSRICGDCDAERQLPEALRTSTARSLIASGAVSLGTSALSASSASSSATSHASQLNECPVCNTTLAALGSQSIQEVHVQTCLETGGGGGGAVQSGRYLVYRLPVDSPIMGRECVICLEELDLGQMIARLNCLCFFHRNCIDSWLARGRSCPTHAR